MSKEKESPEVGEEAEATPKVSAGTGAENGAENGMDSAAENAPKPDEAAAGRA